MTDPTSEQVVAFWDFMAERYGSRLMRKSDSSFMAVVAGALDLFGVTDKDAFMERFTTTIEKTIYVPFDVGVPSEHYSLWGQVVICVHEHQHVQQFIDEGVGFMAKYLARPAQRARYEAEAYRAGMEMDWWRGGEMRPPMEMAVRLRSYGCSQHEIANAAQILTLSQETIRYGGVISPVAKAATVWLEKHAPGLRA